MPALGRFGPLALAVAALAAICMALMAWSHLSWRDLQDRGHAFDTLLTQTRLESLRGQQLADQRLDKPARGAPAPLNAAVVAARQLLETPNPAMRQPLQTLLNRLESAQHLFQQRQAQPDRDRKSVV